MEEIINTEEQPIIPIEDQEIEEKQPDQPEVVGPEEVEVIHKPEPVPDPWDEVEWHEDDPTPVDVTYIKDGKFIPFTMRINPETNHVGETLEDYQAGAWIELSDDQLVFHEKNPEATPEEVFNMKIIKP